MFYYMEKLTELIYNFNTDCRKRYTKVTSYLGCLLDESLQEIERFYYSEFWNDRFKRRLREENINYDPIELDKILGTISLLKEDTQFKIFEDDPTQNGVSNKDTMIALNNNLDEDEKNNSHINNIVMHEFGHRQYNQKEFDIIRELNSKIIKDPKDFIKDKTLTKNDVKYFTDHNELRQRIIPLVKEMVDNDWNPYELYQYSKNLNIDDIKTIYNKKYLITLIENIL